MGLRDGNRGIAKGGIREWYFPRDILEPGRLVEGRRRELRKLK